MIPRDIEAELRRQAAHFPVVCLTGPRQSGKSTLCRALFPDKPYVSLEAPDVRAFASDDPRGFLGQFPTGAVLDEVQRVPNLPSYLQTLVDEQPAPGQWILTGSQNFLLLAAVGQSLAGRAAVLHLLPLSRREVERFADHPTALDEALVVGGYPRILDRRIPPADWLSAYVATYIERDVRAIANIGDLVTFQRFVELCAGRTGQLLNLSSLASDVGVTQPTIKAWLSVLEASFLAFRLPAFASNQRKRLVKMPKLHFYDSGLVCWLLGIRSAQQLRAHPLRGAIFESWVIAEVAKQRANAGLSAGMWFYRDRDGVEADLVVQHEGRVHLVEVKAAATVAPGLLGGIERVRAHLATASGEVEATLVYGGDDAQRRTGVQVVPWQGLQALDLFGAR